jgi:hypothetical protein
MDPYSRILDFIGRRRYFSINYYFSENVAAAGIEPGPLDL